MRKVLWVGWMAGLLALSACAANPRPRVGVDYVVREPPAERVEVVPVSPGHSTFG
jgi:hypothetical protein